MSRVIDIYYSKNRDRFPTAAGEGTIGDILYTRVNDLNLTNVTWVLPDPNSGPYVCGSDHLLSLWTSLLF